MTSLLNNTIRSVRNARSGASCATSLARPAALLALCMASWVMAALTGGCAVLAGGAAGAATGYIAGHEAAENEVEDHNRRKD